MTITLKPELEDLIHKHRNVVCEKIDRAIAQADRGEAMSPEKSRAWLEEKKAEWRNEQLHR